MARGWGRTITGRSVSHGYRQRPMADLFLESLTESSLYSIGASFCDRSPGPRRGSARAEPGDRACGARGMGAAKASAVESAFQTLVTGLAVRYYCAVAGQG